MQRFLAAATVAGLVLAATPAHADTVAQCVDSFENAQRAQKNGHLVFARKLFQECLVPSCPKAVREDCTQGSGSVDRAIATITVVVRDPSGADVPATIKVDGNPLVVEPGRASPIDPGSHQFQYIVGDDTKLATIVINEGEKSRVIVLPTNGAAPTHAPAAATATPPPPEEGASKGAFVGPVIVGGLGVLFALAATGAFVLTNKEASQRDDQQAIFNDPGRTQLERNNAGGSANSHNDAADNDRLAGILLGAGAAVLIGGAVAWYFLSKPAKTSAARLSPVFTF